jgi:hypothetical protein
LAQLQFALLELFQDGTLVLLDSSGQHSLGVI